MIALAVPALMALTGWTWLAPFTLPWLLLQLPMAAMVAGWLLDRPPAVVRSDRPAARQPVFRRPAVVVVMRAADVSTMAAWRARETAGRVA
jgi:hypothetical protein